MNLCSRKMLNLGYFNVLVLVAGSAGVAAATPLKVSDLSILYPLKAFSEKDAIFQTSGDGFCLAPGLGENNILSNELFQAFTDEALGAKGTELCDSEGDFDALISEEVALLQPTKPLAKMKGIPPEACHFKAWKVVGFRFDPCLNRVGKQFTSKADLSSCQSEARIIAQPFVKFNNQPGWSSLDFSAHLIYKVDNSDTLIADLKKVAQKLRISEAKASWDSFDGHDGILRPSHALRNEMASCSGEASTALRKFFEKNTNSSKLTQIAWMASSHSVMHWSFGFLTRNGNKLTPGTLPGGGFHDNFSNTQFSSGKGFPFNQTLQAIPLLGGLPHIGAVKADLMKPNISSAEAVRVSKQIDILNDILNPLKVGQPATTCFSCHVAQQAIAALGSKVGNTNMVGSRPYKPDAIWPTWPGKNRGFLNFRNFGYGPRFELGVSARTINESDDILKILKVTHP